MVDKVDSNKRCKTVLNLLGKILKSDEADVLCVLWSEVNAVIDKIMTISSDTKILKLAHAFTKSMKHLSQIRNVSPPKIRLELLRRTRCWRRYSADEIMWLHQNPNLKCWHFAEIVLDWVKVNETVNYMIFDKLKELVNNDLNSVLSKNLSPGFYDYSVHIKETFNKIHISDVPCYYFFQWMINLLNLMVGLKLNKLSVRNVWRRYRNPVRLTVSIICKYIFLCIAVNLGLFLYKLVVEHNDKLRYTCDYNTDGSSICYPQLGPLEAILIFIFLFLLYKVLRYSSLMIIPCLRASGVINLFQWTVYIALGKRNILRLADSSIVTIHPYFKSILRLLPFFRAELKLLNLKGAIVFDLRNPHWETDYCISHCYITYYGNTWFDGSEFVSTFTNTHGELVKFLNSWSEVPMCNKIFSDFCYYLCGCSSLQIRALSSFLDEYEYDSVWKGWWVY